MIQFIVMARYGGHSGVKMTAEATNLQDEKQDACIASGRPRATSVSKNTQASDPYPPKTRRLQCFQTPTGVKFLILAEPRVSSLDALLRQVYSLYRCPQHES